MKAQLQYEWIKDSDFQVANPLTVKVRNVIMEDKDRIMQFELTGNGELRQMSLYARNWNMLITKLGDETDNWNGRVIRIMQTIEPNTDKKIKTIEV